MCGIFCSVYDRDEKSVVEHVWNDCKNYILDRGPNYNSETREHFTSELSGFFAASVLWTQGKDVFPQPSVDKEGNILLWNGDVFSGKLCSDSDSDTQTILTQLRFKKPEDHVVSVLEQVEGPFSFIYYEKSKNTLHFGRDRIGRHSLLLRIAPAKKSLVVSSVLTRASGNTAETAVIELPTIGTFSLDLNDPSEWKLSLVPWKKTPLSEESLGELRGIVNVQVEEWEIKEVGEARSFSYQEEALNSEYAKIVNDLSGVRGDPSFKLKIMDRFLESEEINKRVDELLDLLHASIEVRVTKKPDFCKLCCRLNSEIEISQKCDHSKIGIAFSGGLDSAILAVIADKFVSETESIDLINVAFEIKDGGVFDVPDRLTGRETYRELSEICPRRKWNFVEANTTRNELGTLRSSRIADLIFPAKTILDESLGCAVWFASRGKGTLFDEPYDSSCRILLFGMGADELFGGYMRHRTTLKHRGWGALSEELEREIARISSRNLGRDDRVSADHGKQPRFPFLDENIVDFARNLRPWERCYPTEKMECGFGDKLLLRLAAIKLNLRRAANLPKRAFQFGSRIANSKENAKHVSTRL